MTFRYRATKNPYTGRWELARLRHVGKSWELFNVWQFRSFAEMLKAINGH